MAEGTTALQYKGQNQTCLFRGSTVVIMKIVYSLYSQQMNVHYLNPSDPPLDLAVMGRADYFIGNCVSSFTAFVKRERDVHGKPTEFFGFETLLHKKKFEKTEL